MVRRLRAFAGAGRAQQNESHGLLGVSCSCVQIELSTQSRLPEASGRGRTHALPGRPACRHPAPAVRRLTCTAMRSPCHSTRNCSSASTRLERRVPAALESGAETRAVGVQAHVAQRAARRLNACASACGRANAGSMRARSTARARPTSQHHLHHVGVGELLAASSMACATVAITQSLRCFSSCSAGVDHAWWRSAARRLAR